MKRTYTCTMTNGGGFGSGYGGTYDTEFTYQSEHRAGSKANASDARVQWKKRHSGWADVKPGSVRLARFAE